MKRTSTLILILMALMCLWGANAWALEEKDGVYQIGNGEDLVAFSELVNNGETSANAVLTPCPSLWISRG